MVWTSIFGFLKGAWMKAILAGAVIAAIGYGITFVLNWYEIKIQDAYTQGQSEIIYDQSEETVKDYEKQIEYQKREKEELSRRLVISVTEINKLKKQLLIDHDLDKLLQAKPGLTLKAVNAGTGAVFAELQEISQ